MSLLKGVIAVSYGVDYTAMKLMVNQNRRVGQARTLGLAMLAVWAVGCTGGSAPKADLDVMVNGEAFAEAGMLSKDGWQISFDEVTVTVGEITVSGAPSDGGGDGVDVPWTLGEGAETAEAAEGEGETPPGFVAVSLQEGPVKLGPQPVPVGTYSQVKWRWGTDSTAAIALKGTAVQGDQSIPFDLQLPGSFQAICGDYVGEERKGVVTADSGGEVELTLHLDHLFGDGEAAPNDEINTQSFGFNAFAETASEQGVVVTPATWDAWGTPALRQSLQDVLLSMPHVGEGHCDVY